MKERKCVNCGKPMDFEPCEALECDDGYDADDCLGMKKCSHCFGEGGKWFCWECDSDYDEDEQ